MRTLSPLIVLLWLVLAAPAVAATLPEDSNAAVILAYFEISDDPGATSAVSPQQFRAQMAELANAGAHVMALSDIVAAWKEGKALPANAVAITFEGGYRSVLENAVPVLEDNNWPYTVFIAPHQQGRENGRFAEWEDLQDLQDDKLVSYGLLPMRYQSFGDDDTTAFWTSINSARSSFRENMNDAVPAFVAYPYGIPPQNFSGDLAAHGFVAGFGLESGVANAASPRWLLPRFTMTQAVGDDDRIRQLMQAAAFPASDIQPIGGRVTVNPPAIGFTLPDLLKDKAKNTACRASDGQTAKLAMLANSRAELRFAQPLSGSRVRVNCTLVDGDEDGEPRYRWLGFLFELPDTADDGETVFQPMQDGGELSP